MVCGPASGRDLGTSRRRPAGAGLLAAADGRALRRAAAARRTRRRRRGVGAAGRLHAVRPTRGLRRGARRRPGHPGRAVHGQHRLGRRLDPHHRELGRRRAA